MNKILTDATIMVIDDTPANIKLLHGMLSGLGFKVAAFSSGSLALKGAKINPPDIILLDINMPEMNGYEVCQKLKDDPDLKKIPVIFISALSEIMNKVQAFKIGGVDYITKPFDFEEVRLRVETHLKITRLQQRVNEFNQQLQEKVKEQTAQILEDQRKIADGQIAMILVLAKLSECRDNDTGTHLDRVQYYCRELAEGLASKSFFTPMINEDFTSTIMHAAALHDIGKVGIPDHILLKPGKLTAEEFAIMKTHCNIGAKTIAQIVEKYPENTLLVMAIDIVHAHHENWDGTGYPQGLKGEDIPLCARIMAVADVYDALRSKRPYKKGFSHREACELIMRDRGIKFDPDIVDTFCEIDKTFDDIFIRHSED